MKKSLLSLAVGLVLCSPSAFAVVNGAKVDKRTVGAGGAQDYVVGITITEKDGATTITSYCTGVLISPTSVLTAGHCAHKKPAVKFNGKGLEVKSISLLSGFNYNGSSVSNDLAIIKLKKAPKSGFRVARLPDRNESLKSGLNLNIIGYGRTGLNSKIMLKDDMGVLRKGLTNTYMVLSKDSEIIVDQSIGAGICQGDSGSPLLEENTQGFTAWGIASTASRASFQKYVERKSQTVSPEAAKKIMTAEELTKFLNQNPHVDYCKGTGVYFDLTKKLDWIKATLTQP